MVALKFILGLFLCLIVAFLIWVFSGGLLGVDTRDTRFEMAVHVTAPTGEITRVNTYRLV